MKRKYLIASVLSTQLMLLSVGNVVSSAEEVTGSDVITENTVTSVTDEYIETQITEPTKIEVTTTRIGSYPLYTPTKDVSVRTNSLRWVSFPYYDDGVDYKSGETPLKLEIDDETVAEIVDVKGASFALRGILVGGETFVVVTAPDGSSTKIGVKVAYPLTSEVTQAEFYSTHIKGDVDCNGIVSTSDIVRLLQYLVGDIELSQEERASADINSDSKLSIVDLIKLKNYVLFS